MLTDQSAKIQIPLLLEHYPNLTIIESDSSIIRLNGSIEIYRSANNFTLNQTYKVQIDIYLNNYTLPKIKDCGNSIDSNYPHRNQDGTLCLETDTAIRLRFIDKFDLMLWMDEYVEVYYFTYEYQKRYGVFPFGERPHGVMGIIHTYQEIFNEEDIDKTLNLMIYIYTEKSYRGHLMCPCGSGKRLRNCHGKSLYNFMVDSRYKEILTKDLSRILAYMKGQGKNGFKGKNTSQTK